MQVGSMFFSDIRIIQSLNDGERKTGTELFETLRYYGYKDAKLQVKIDEVSTIDELKEVFANIKEQIRTQRRIPIIHLEIHGAEDKSGLILSSGDYVPWIYLVHELVVINYLTHNSLILVMGVCYGSYIGLDAIARTFTHAPTQMLDGRSPFTQMIASDVDVTDKQIYDAFLDFYTHMMSEDFDPDRLLINRVPGLFAISSMESYVNYLIGGLKSMIESPRFKTESRNAMNRLRITNPASLPKGPDHLAFAAFVKNRKAFYKSRLEEMRDRYLMIDLFPENKKRFIPFERAWRTQGPRDVDISSLFPLEEIGPK